MTRQFIGALLVSCGFLFSTATCVADERPNIILVLADDLGYGDLGCFGARDVQTPHLDRFAAEGLRLTSCYAGHANCSPSRTALMTGRTPTRAGIRNWIPHGSTVHLRASEVTIATLLRQAGYSTCHVGKWHLTGQFNEPTQPQPGDHGFDHWFSTQNNALPNHHDPDNFVRNGRAAGRIEGYSAQVVVSEAIQWVRSGRDKTKPFFLFVCFHEPHEPIASDERYARLYPHADPAYTAHHANITQMDDAFGRLMRAIDEDGLRDRSLVFFTSDNGPAITPQHPYGSAGPLRDKKGNLTEGGIRVPGIVRWPGKVMAGRVSDEPVCGVDFLPTVCDIVGVKQPSDRPLDGTSLGPLFSGQSIARREPLYWHFNRAAGEFQVALRAGDWKILATRQDTAPLKRHATNERDFKTAEPVSFSLYNLRGALAKRRTWRRSDGETCRAEDIATQQVPSSARQKPTWPAWTFDNREGQRIQWPDYVKNRRKGGEKAKR
jgi:arylsulfatase A